MTREPKRPQLADVEAQRPRLWAGGSRTTESKERARAEARRRATIAKLAMRRKAAR